VIVQQREKFKIVLYLTVFYGVLLKRQEIVWRAVGGTHTVLRLWRLGMHSSSLEEEPPSLATLISSSKLHSMVGKAKACSTFSISRQRLDMPYGLLLLLLLSPSGECRILFLCIVGARCSSTRRDSSNATVAGRVFRLNAAAAMSFMFIIVVKE
jgi:hypothetical protein